MKIRVQNDWNGTAKVALISIVRSISAWDILAQTTRDPDAHQIADALYKLRRQVEDRVPECLELRAAGLRRRSP